MRIMRQLFTQPLQRISYFIKGLALVGLLTAPGIVLGQNYCVPTGDDPCAGFPDYIEGVELNNLSNTNNGCGGVYNDFTNLSTTVTYGQSYQLVVNEQSSEWVRVWIDYNNNGTFEPSESVAANGDYDGINTQIKIPCDAVGGKTRMRVRSLDFSGTLGADDACGNINDGTETEDYTIDIKTPKQQKQLLSYNISQITGTAFPGQNFVANTEIFFDFTNTCGGLALDTLYLSQGNTTNPANDLAEAKLISNGPSEALSPTFSGRDVIGNVVRNPSSNTYKLVINKDRKLFQEYLYIVHDLKRGAQRGNLVDVSIDSFILGGRTIVPRNGNPAGGIDIRGSKTYCKPSQDRQAAYLVGIDSFKLAGSDYFVTQPESQGSGPDYYSDFSNSKITVNRNRSHVFKIATGSINGTRAKGWVDWNNDGKFTPNREEVFFIGQFEGNASGTIEVPCYADTGMQRLRIASRFGTNFAGYNALPCGPSGGGLGSNGEYEDYRIQIKPVPEANPAFSAPDMFFVNSPDSLFSDHVRSPNLTYEWDIDNDGTYEKEGFAISQIFTATGSKQVTLKATRNACGGTETKTNTKTIAVVGPQQIPEVDFLASQNVTPVNQVVKLNDYTANGPVSWSWTIAPARKRGNKTFEFVNGTAGSSQNPEIRFLQKGEYDVKLTATNRNGSGVKTVADYIRVKEGAIICQDQLVRDQQGFLYDPGGPNGRTGDNNCSITIAPSCADSTILNFTEFDLSDVFCNANASPDNIKVWDGRSTNGVPLHVQAGFPGGFTNNAIPSQNFTLTANSGSFYIEYSAGGCADGKGFVADWQAFQSAPATAKQQIQQNQVVGPDTVFERGIANYDNSVDYPGAVVNFVFPSGEVIQSNDDPASKQITVGKGDYQVQVVTEYCGFSDTAFKDVHVEPVNQDPSVDFVASEKRFSVGDTIQLTDQSFNGINEWRWKIGSGSNSPASFVRGSSANSENPFVVINQPGTYRVELVASNAEGQDINVKLDYLEVVDYCTPSVRSFSNDFAINRFTLSQNNQGTLINNSTNYDDSDGYTASSYPDAKLEAGRQYTVTIQRLTSFNPVSYVVYADLNKNGKLESSEVLVSDASVNGTTYTDTFTLPGNINGGFNRLRVASGLAGQVSGPCSSPTGEVEDYKLPILGDQTPPVISLKGSKDVTTRACTNPGFNQGAVASDLVDGNLTNQIQRFGGYDSTSAGNYEITYQVADQAGNEASVTQNITVLPDTTKPTINLNGTKTLQVDVFNDFQDPGVNAQDGCGSLKGIKVKGQVNTEILGAYNLQYTAVDQNGNQRSVSRTVNVVDNVDPEVTIRGGDTVSVPVFGTYEDPGVGVSDNYYDSVALTVNGQVSTQEVGTYELEYVATDKDGNTTRKSRIVEVVDNQGPTASQVEDGVFVLDVNNRLTYPYSIEDNYYSASQIDLIEQGGTYFNLFPDGVADSLGVFKAAFTFEDGSGNQNTVNVPVEVVDREAPQLTLQKDVVNLPRYQKFNDSLGQSYTISDNYFADTSITVNRTGNYFSEYVSGAFDNGLYQIKYQAIDPAGNSSEVQIRGINVTPTGIDGENGKITVDVYPNPTDGNVRIDTRGLDEQPQKFEVINSKGQTVRIIAPESSNSPSSHYVDLSSEASGLYKIKLQTTEKVITRSIIVQ